MDEPITIPDIDALKTHVTREVFERVVRRTPRKTGRAQDGWEMDLTSHKISNPVPYIGILESGSSEQAPEGMVRITLEEIPSIIDNFLKETKR